MIALVAFGFWFLLIQGPAPSLSRGLMRRLLRLLPAVRRALAGRGLARAARAPRRGAPPPPGGPAAAGPLRRRLARAAAPGGDQRGDVRAAPRGQRLPGRDAAARRRSPPRTTSRPTRVMIGHGAGELLRAALRAVATRRGRDRLARLGAAAAARRPRRARRRCRSPRRRGRGRTVVLCRPNDPTGAVPRRSSRGDALADPRRGAGGVRRTAWTVVDHPRVIQVRSFSKAHAMAGLRIGYAIVPEGGPDLAPVLGVGAPALAAALWAVESGADVRAAPARAGRRAARAAGGGVPGRRRASGRTRGWRCRWPRSSPRGGSTSRPGRPGATSTTSA